MSVDCLLGLIWCLYVVPCLVFNGLDTMMIVFLSCWPFLHSHFVCGTYMYCWVNLPLSLSLPLQDGWEIETIVLQRVSVCICVCE